MMNELDPRSQEVLDNLAGKDTAAFVNLYPQECHHGEASIVGNLYGLLALRDTIDSALKKSKKSRWQIKSEKLEIFASDGEGYELTIKLTDEWGETPFYNLYQEKGDSG
jgi:hypothetical protein